MPDISMCQNKNCHLRDKCYRYRAIPDDVWQSYICPTIDSDTMDCDYFWSIENRDPRRLRSTKAIDALYS